MMATVTLTRKDHTVAKKIRLVASQTRRAHKDLVVAEGIRVLEDVSTSGREIEVIVISEAFGQQVRERALLINWKSSKTRIYRASEAVLKSLSGVHAPQGVLALVRVPLLTFGELGPTAASLILCACGIQDPGNLGTLIRSAAAAGATLVCTSSGTVSARNPKCIRSSAGAFFRMPIVESASASQLLTFCRSWGVTPVWTDAQEGTAYWEYDFRKPTAIVLGNEGQGIMGVEWSKVPAIRIPMLAGTESLNVGAAGAILLFEALRQRVGPQAQPKEGVAP